MDVFKLLSRSTNLGRKKGTEQNLPSSGQQANPQIFGHDVTKGAQDDDSDVRRQDNVVVLGKRKRHGRAREEVPKELDFFGHGEPTAVRQDSKSLLKTSEKCAERGSKGATGAEYVSLGEEQRKAILKAHKIKITSLENMEHTTNKSLKPSKKRKAATIGSSKSEAKQQKRQIYPEPLSSFSDLRSRYSISRRLAENLEAQGYKTPTEVQLAALPLLMDGEAISGAEGNESHMGCQLLSVAPTGSGKTLAFLIPTINAILRDKRSERDEHTQGIVLAPTRELAHQIVNEGKKLLQNTGIRITLMRKGMRLAGSDITAASDNESDSDAASEIGADRGVVKSHIIVSTPLVLANSLRSPSGRRTALGAVQHLILDEADVLLDPLFRDQVETLWSACINPDVRITLWSATMGSSIEGFAMEQFKKLGHRGRVPIIRLVVGLKDTALPTLTHTMIYTGTEAGKLLALRQLLHPTAPDTDSEGRKSLRPPFLVFTQTIERTKALQAELRYDIPPEAGGSARMAALHSEMSEKAREKIMTEFRKGEIWVIITTDLLARGVDFRGLNGVVNYDVPTSAAAYVHRVGRTGRAGREGGVAVTFYTKEDIPYVKPIANVIAASEKLRGAEGRDVNGHKDLQQWILNALPTPTKREKKELKRQGVEARRKGAKSAMITTKSGYERWQNSKKRNMRSATKGANAQPVCSRAEDDFAGFSD